MSILIDKTSRPMSISSSLQCLSWMVWSPSRTFHALQENPSWLGAFLAISLGTVATTWLTVPIFQELSLTFLSPSLPIDQLERIMRINQIARYLATAGAFLITLLYWFISTLLLWLIVQVFEGLAPFRTIFAVVAHANVVSLFSGVLVTALILVKWQMLQGRAVGPQDLEIKLGLDLFWEGELHPSLRVLLMSLNPFNLWYYGLLILGIRTVDQLDWPRAAGVIGVFWTFWVAFGAGIAWVVGTVIE